MFIVDDLITENIHNTPLGWKQLQGVLQRYSPNHQTGFGWQEIVFQHSVHTGKCHFLGAGAYWCEENRTPESLFSSLFRSDPTEDLPCPWEDVYCFCETVLSSCGDRIFPPFVRLNHSDFLELSNLYLLRNFNYQSMNWYDSVLAIATQEQEYV